MEVLFFPIIFFSLLFLLKKYVMPILSCFFRNEIHNLFLDCILTLCYA